MVESVTYGEKLWTINKEIKIKINVIELGLWARCKMDRIPNEKISTRMEVENTEAGNIGSNNWVSMNTCE